MEWSQQERQWQTLAVFLDWRGLVDRVTLMPEYLTWLRQIAAQQDFSARPAWHKQFAGDHGLAHACRVARTVALLLDDLAVDGRLVRLGALTGLLHDVGMAAGKPHHAQRSAEWAAEFARKYKLASRRRIGQMAHAIAAHGDGG
ncbi:HD domain-containing protein, partial [bacterium]|nr:HD domain-containing protein [bacterium]